MPVIVPSVCVPFEDVGINVCVPVEDVATEVCVSLETFVETLPTSSFAETSTAPLNIGEEAECCSSSSITVPKFRDGTQSGSSTSE